MVKRILAVLGIAGLVALASSKSTSYAGVDIPPIPISSKGALIIHDADESSEFAFYSSDLRKLAQEIANLKMSMY